MKKYNNKKIPAGSSTGLTRAPDSRGNGKPVRRSVRLANLQAKSDEINTVPKLNDRLFTPSKIQHFSLPTPLRTHTHTLTENDASSRLLKQHKTHCEPTDSPDLNHSIGIHTDDTPSPGVSYPHKWHTFSHPDRKNNTLPHLNHTIKPELQLPTASDKKAWTSIDAALHTRLTKHFTATHIKHSDTTTLIDELETHIYSYIHDTYGVKQPRPPPPPNRKPDPKLTDFRTRKKQCRTAWRTYQKNNLTHLPEAKLLKQKWHTLVRQHNKYRVQKNKQHSSRSRYAATSKFKNDPFGYADTLFNGKSKNNTPTFSQETAEEHFSKTYSDPNRSHRYSPLENQPRPPPPKFPFNSKPYNFKGVKKLIKNKRNTVKPGFGGIRYIIYKKCNTIVRILVTIYAKIWKTRVVPNGWGLAFFILLSKSSILDLPAEFRPIALTSTGGKIFFSGLFLRFHEFFTQNNYITREIQKRIYAVCPRVFRSHIRAMGNFQKCKNR